MNNDTGEGRAHIFHLHCISSTSILVCICKEYNVPGYTHCRVIFYKLCDFVPCDDYSNRIQQLSINMIREGFPNTGELVQVNFS